MPIYFYWGEDDFAIAQAVSILRDRVVDPQWASFNYDRIAPDLPDAAMQGLNPALTAPFGAEQRFVWLVDTALCQHCSADLLAELERTLPTIPDSTVLLMTARSKPDGRLKSTKLLQKHAEFREFSPIPPWKTEQLVKQAREAAQAMGVKLTNASTEFLAEAVGNNTRQLFSELEKLRLYSGGDKQPLPPEVVTSLVTANAQSSLQLAATIREGQAGAALQLIEELIARNEPALRIVATLTGQFRTWLWVKLMVDSGERNERAIAQAAGVGNPKRIYFLKKEVTSMALSQLQQTLPLLLELETALKRGAPELATLQTKIIELCQLF